MVTKNFAPYGVTPILEATLDMSNEAISELLAHKIGEITFAIAKYSSGTSPAVGMCTNYTSLLNGRHHT